MTLKKGFIFVATGSEYVQEAKSAAISVKRFHPNDKLTLYTDQKTTSLEPFDSIEYIQKSGNGFLDKIICMSRSPYKKTVFMDTDTRMIASCSELFEILDNFPIAAAHAPGYKGIPDPQICDAFYEFNTGVVAFRNSQEIFTLFDIWAEYYRNTPVIKGAEDQPAFRWTVWKLKIPIFVLPPEYNYRTMFPAFFRDKVKIIHGRVENYDQLAANINATLQPRCIKAHKD